MKLLDNKPVQTFMAVGPLVFFIVCFLGYVAFFVSAFSSMQVTHNLQPVINDEWNFNTLFILTLAGSVFFMISIVYFVLHAAQNSFLQTGNAHVMWILIIILLTGLGSFIYWLLEIRNKRTEPVIGDTLHRKKQAGWSGGLYIKN